MKNFIQKGDVIDYTAGADIVSGQIVKLQHCVGVAVADIANGEVGPVAIEGVFELAKVSGAVFAAGEKLLFDTSANSSAGAFDDSAATPATGDLMGAAVAVRPGENGETTCLVKLTPGNATRT